MSYKVYYTELGVSEKKPMALFTLPSAQFVNKEAAMVWARKTKGNGATIWKIEGPGGFVLTHEDFERKYWRM